MLYLFTYANYSGGKAKSARSSVHSHCPVKQQICLVSSYSISWVGSVVEIITLGLLLVMIKVGLPVITQLTILKLFSWAQDLQWFQSTNNEYPVLHFTIKSKLNWSVNINLYLYLVLTILWVMYGAIPSFQPMDRWRDVHFMWMQSVG